MGDVGGIGGAGRREDFSAEELDRMHTSESTSHAMSAIRKDAHYADLDGEVVLRGDDKRFMEQRAEFRGETPKGEAVNLGFHGTSTVLEVASLAAKHAEVFEAAGLVMLPVSSVVMLGAGIYALHKANEEGEILKATATKDEMHVAMLSVLQVPNEFKSEQMAEYTITGKGWQSGAQKMVSALSTTANKPVLALLQLHADQGMDGARKMVDAGITNKTGYLASHPAMSERYASDPAFKAGFDAVLWAHKQPGDVYKGLIGGLEARDVRYEQHHIQFRA